MSGPVIDLFLVYQFLKRLTTPFKETEAFRLGLIDAEGKRLKKAQTTEERRAVGYFDRLVFNLKRLLAKVPGGSSQIASYAAALLLLREQDQRLVDDEKYLEEELRKEMMSEQIDVLLNEDAAANATGAAVAGTGDDPIHWSRRQPRIGLKGSMKKYGQPIDYMAFLRRRRAKFMKENAEKESVYYKILKRPVPSGKSSSARGGNGDGGNGNGGESVNATSPNSLNERLTKVNGKWALVSRKTGRPLAYYKGEGKPGPDWVSKQEKRIQFFKHGG
jgi:hypothetical protein